jgi:hypothetical protein
LKEIFPSPQNPDQILDPPSIKEHKYNLTQGLLKTKLAQAEYEAGHEIRVSMEKRRVQQTEPNTTYRRYKESAHMSLIDHAISQPSLDISPIWSPIIAAEAKKKNYNSVQWRLSGKIVFLCWYHTENSSV